MRKTLFTFITALAVVFNANAQSKLSSQAIKDKNLLRTGSRSNNSQISFDVPKPSQTGSKAMLINQGFVDTLSVVTAGWSWQNLSTTIGTATWMQGLTSAFNAYEGGADEYFACNFNSTTATNTISNWLITPVVSITNGDVLSFWTRTATSPATYPDRLQVRMSQNGASTNVGATATSVGDFTTLLLDINPTYTSTGYPNVWTQYTITISGVTGTVSGRFAFRYFVENGGPTGTRSNYIGIDLVQFDHPVAGTYDVAFTPEAFEYTIFPISQIGNHTFEGNIDNVGVTGATNAVMNVAVNNGSTDIWTGSSAPIATLAVGADQDVTTTTAWPAVVGDFSIEYEATITETDVNTLNNVDTNYFSVSDSVYARDDGAITGGLGIGAGNGGWLGNQYSIVANVDITSVTYAITKGYIGERTACVVWDMVAGLPNAVVASTDTILYTTEDTTVFTLKIAGGPVSLAPGEYVVTICEFDSTVQAALTNTIFTLGTTWVNWPTSPAGGWANNEYFGVSGYMKSYMIRPNLRDNAASINDHTNNNNIMVYPSPSDGLINIKNATNGKLIVFDLAGRQIFNGIIDSDHFELNLSNCDMGMYFLNIDNNVYKVVLK